MNLFDPSAVQQIVVRGRNFYLKRDDLLSKDFSGNKARKFYKFLEQDLSSYTKIISHGSVQSNAMYSLSVLAKRKNLQFDYYVSHIPSFLVQNPVGNYKQAVLNKTNIIQAKPPAEFKEDELFIPEGGAMQEAKEGIELLAKEIVEWAELKQIKDLKVFLPSGTGTTALFLQHFLPFEVYTCSCVGDDSYLQKQFATLLEQNHPTILPKKKKYHFGKLYREFYEMYKELLEQTKIEFDLLYDPLGWITLLDANLGGEILYIHQGGLLGNETMLQRYERKYSASV